MQAYEGHHEDIWGWGKLCRSLTIDSFPFYRPIKARQPAASSLKSAGGGPVARPLSPSSSADSARLCSCDCCCGAVVGCLHFLLLSRVSLFFRQEVSGAGLGCLSASVRAGSSSPGSRQAAGTAYAKHAALLLSRF